MIFASTPSVVDTESDISDEEPECRICRCSSEEGNLFAPCGCKGSVRWIHRDCLRRWVTTATLGSHNNLEHCTRCNACMSPWRLGPNYSVCRDGISLWGFVKGVLWPGLRLSESLNALARHTFEGQCHAHLACCGLRSVTSRTLDISPTC